jgi:plastocyanin
MRRWAIAGAVLVTLVATAVALGSGTGARIHRLHVPPPPTASADESAPPSDVTDPAPPATPAPPPVAPPPGPPPPPSPPSPPSPPGPGTCTATGGGTPADVTGQLSDYALGLAPSSVPAAPTLRVRGVNVGSDTHTIAIRPLGGALLCATPAITGGNSDTFAITNLVAGTYQIYCTIHPSSMQATFTVS